MDTILEQLKKTLDTFNANLEAEVTKMRAGKADATAMSSAFSGGPAYGRYIHDDRRIIISAPEIIIGNVNPQGLLNSNGGNVVVVRGNKVSLEGVAASPSDIAVGGEVVTRAASIRQEAVDPGTDGMENVVMQNSEIVNQARSIVIDSSAATGVFPMSAARRGALGVSVHSDTALNLEATLSVKTATSSIKSAIDALKKEKDALKQTVKKGKSDIEQMIKALDDLYTAGGKLGKDEEDLKSNIYDVVNLDEQVRLRTQSLIVGIEEYVRDMSRLAEVNRRLTMLDRQQKNLSQVKDLTKVSTGAHVNITGEVIKVAAEDGDGNVRKNVDAGMIVNVPTFSVTTHDAEGALIEGSSVSFNSGDINLSTTNTKFKDKDKHKNADMATTGSVTVISKNIRMESVDYELKDGKAEEKALTKDGNIFMRSENVIADIIDKTGKATGKVSLNAKQVEVKALDQKVEKDKPVVDDKIAAGGSLIMTAEKVKIGSRKKDDKTKTLQVAAETLALLADKTAEMQQGEAKAVVTLDGGNATVGASKVQVEGNTTVNGTAEIKGETKVPKLSADHVEAKTSFKSSNISDGIPVPPPPPTPKVSAKLKMEEEKAK